jgi:hypothetical protein
MKIGIILPHLMPSQLSFEIFDIINNGQTSHEYTIFYENISKVFNPPFCPIMNISEMKYFSGRLVGFSLDTVNYMLKSIKIVEPILYLYDIEWLRGKTNYLENVNKLRQITTLTRTEQYADIISKYANIECEAVWLEDVICPREVANAT